MSRVRSLAAIAIAVVALGVAGCGDDGEADPEVSAPDSTSAAPGEPAAAGSLAFEDIQPRLEEAGYTLEEEEPEGLIRRDDGAIVVADEKVVASGGELPDGADVSIYSLGSAKDVEAMEAFAGGDVSLVQGSVYFQSSEPGAAETVATAAGG